MGELKGEELYRALQKHLLAELPCGDAGYDTRVIMLFSSLYEEAKTCKSPPPRPI